MLKNVCIMCLREHYIIYIGLASGFLIFLQIYVSP